MIHRGGCHCGNIAVQVDLLQEPADVPVRACDCSFCRGHGARTASNPDGHLDLWAKDWAAVAQYRFESFTADFLICSQCGTYVATVCETPSGLRAVINLNALEDRAAFTAPPVVSQFTQETMRAKLERRSVHWMPCVLHEGQP